MTSHVSTIWRLLCIVDYREWIFRLSLISISIFVNPASALHHLCLHIFSDVLHIWHHCTDNFIMINIQPLKMFNLQYPLTDILFIFLLRFTKISLLEKEIANLEIHFHFYTTMTVMAALSAFVPLLYISYLIGSWLLSK